MPKVCLYFELHQPYRLEDINIFDIGNKLDYFEDRGDEINRVVFQKVTNKSYVPMLNLLKKLVYEYPDFKFTFSASGIFLEQALRYSPIVIDLLKSLVKSGQVEVLAETYHHSLAALYSKSEFEIQIKEHEELVKEIFGVVPKVFRNTELIYSNDIAQLVEDQGYIGTLTEAVDRYLDNRSRTQMFVGKTKNKLPLMLKHAQLSDDVAFRFSDKSWKMYPLMVEKYLDWFRSYGENDYINLFMDFETFGEHQWKDTGIFEFFLEFVKQSSENDSTEFVTPTEVFQKYQKPFLKLSLDRDSLPVYDVPEPISWADVDRDLTAWRDNDFQYDTLRLIYDLEKDVLDTKNQEIIRDWRRLQTSDHFYYMCTKWFEDGDVHAYFSPYKSPYEAYTRYSIVLADLRERMI
ncbi:glycoside hydrolase family 57 protein [Patescibacteria group bacterium]|nr:glycoside hydrolase family 57 protein [Patescibacteria group bacterium]